MANRKATYHGQQFDVVNEDNSFVTLEGYGYKKRVRKEEVIYEDEVEDDLIDAMPGEELQQSLPEEELPSEVPDNSLKLAEEDLISQVDANTAKRISSLEQDKAKLKEREAGINRKIASLAKTGMKKKEAEQEKMRADRESAAEQVQTAQAQAQPVVANEGDNQMDKPASVDRESRDVGEKNKTMSPETRDKYGEFNVDVDSETPADIKKTNNDRLKGALEGLRTDIVQKLNELDGLLDEMSDPDTDVFEEEGGPVDQDMEPENAQIIIDPDADQQSQDVNYRNTDNDQVNLDVDEMNSFEQVNEEDEPGEDEDEEQLDECGTAAVAGPGVGDGTVNQATNAVQGIATVPAPLGMQRRQMEQYTESIKEYFTVEDEFVLNEGRGQSALNRHWLADKVEESIDPMNESACSLFERRKARRKAIGNNATLRECACFIAENRFSCDDGGYVPREKSLEESVVLEAMKKQNSKLMRRFRKS